MLGIGATKMKRKCCAFPQTGQNMGGEWDILYKQNLMWEAQFQGLIEQKKGWAGLCGVRGSLHRENDA